MTAAAPIPALARQKVAPLLVVLPALNEAESIGRVIAEVQIGRAHV